METMRTSIAAQQPDLPVGSDSSSRQIDVAQTELCPDQRNR